MSHDILRRVLENQAAATAGGKEAREITVRTFAETPARTQNAAAAQVPEPRPQPRPSEK